MLSVPYQVKKALKQGRKKKEYKFKVYSGGELQFTIDNDNLISESVKIDERMCSGDEIKFGLCEGSSLEFQYFGFDNIRGCEIEAILSVEYDNDGESAYYDIPMGWFTVDQCPKQFSTGIHKVTAYNKLKSDYLDVKANQFVNDLIDAGEYGHDVSLYYLLNHLLEEYTINEYVETVVNQSRAYFWTQGGTQDPEGAIQLYRKVNDEWQATNSYIWVWMQEISCELNNAVSPNNYYKMKLFGDHISNVLLEKVWEASGYEDEYVKINDEYMKISDAVKYNQGTFNTSSSWDTRQLIQGYTQFYQRGPLNYDYTTEAMTNFNSQHDIRIYVPSIVERSSSGHSTHTGSDVTQNSYLIWGDPSSITNEFFEVDYVDVPQIEKLKFDSHIDTDVTLRELQSAAYEIICQYGQLDRETDLFSGVELNGGGLYPSTTLYPGTGLYPNTNITNGDNLHPFPSEYQKLWTDTVGEQSFRYLIITYKGLDENNQEKDFTLQRTVNANGTTDYNMSDNWLFKNLVWTAEDVGDYADAMVTKMQNIRWFPFEMWAAGLPYVETGDAIEITDKEGDTYVSYILQRQLNGIQNLQDTYINGELDIF